MKKLLPILLTATLVLAGCIPAVFIAGTTAGGVVVSDRRDMKTIVTDKKLAYQAMVQLNSEPSLKETTHITVTAFNGVLLLVGEAQNPGAKTRAYELVKIIPNVRRINNEIVIGDPITAKASSLDAWITTKVKTAMVAEKGLNSTQIKVITEDSVVYLLGLVSHDQADTAVEVARSVKDVRKVVTLFEYVR